MQRRIQPLTTPLTVVARADSSPLPTQGSHAQSLSSSSRPNHLYRHSAYNKNNGRTTAYAVGTIKCFEQCTCPDGSNEPKFKLCHHIVYEDGDTEWIDLRELSRDVVAWEVEPFSSDRFAF